MINLVAFDFQEILTSAVGIVPLIVAIVQAVKLTGVPSKWSPLIALVIGILASFLLNHESGHIGETILSGVVFGLSASGLYSGTKTTMKADINENN